MNYQIVTINIRNGTSLILSIDDVGIYCQYTQSENGQFILAFCDGNPFKHVGGYRKEGNGFYFLINNNVLVVTGQIERPNDGKVGNNGWFILNDWLFTDDTESVAYCFDEKGNIIIEKRLRANLLKNAISKNGKFALFQTANSNNEMSNNLFFYDLKSKNLLWQKTCDFAWPKDYTILETEKKINLHYNDIGTISLDWMGNIIGKQEYKLKYTCSLKGNRLVYESMGLIDECSPNESLINLLEKGVNDNETSPYTKAIGLKYLGELFENDDLKKAYLYFEKALECYPKIGLKRKLEILKRKI